MENIELREGISETLDILNHVSKVYIDKIPKKFKKFLEDNRLPNYVSKLDHSQKLNEMNLKEKTKDILSIIYLNFWCDSQEKFRYVSLINENQKRHQEELRKKYNYNNIFK